MRGSLLVVGLFFFKQKTAYELRISDWSSDVCSSDLLRRDVPVPAAGPSWSAAFLLRDGGVLCRRSVRGLRKQRRPGRGMPPAAADIHVRHAAAGHPWPTLFIPRPRRGRGACLWLRLSVCEAHEQTGTEARPPQDGVPRPTHLLDRE